MKSLYLIRGVPGSGKSTLAEELSENGKYPVLSADMYFEVCDKYIFDVTKIKDAHAWCKTCVEETMKLDIDSVKLIGEDLSSDKIFVANTFTQEWEMEDYFKLAQQYGYKVFTIVVENRHGSSSIHDVPEETLTKMKDRFEIVL